MAPGLTVRYSCGKDGAAAYRMYKDGELIAERSFDNHEEADAWRDGFVSCFLGADIRGPKRGAAKALDLWTAQCPQADDGI